MSRWLRTVPAALAGLLLGAHFLRAQRPLLVGLSLLLVILVFVRRPNVRVACRLALALGVLVWFRTAWVLAHARMSSGAPYLRMLWILGLVALFTAAAAWLLPRVDARPPNGPPARGATKPDPERRNTTPSS